MSIDEWFCSRSSHSGPSHDPTSPCFPDEHVWFGSWTDSSFTHTLAQINLDLVSKNDIISFSIYLSFKLSQYICHQLLCSVYVAQHYSDFFQNCIQNYCIGWIFAVHVTDLRIYFIRFKMACFSSTVSLTGLTWVTRNARQSRLPILNENLGVTKKKLLCSVLFNALRYEVAKEVCHYKLSYSSYIVNVWHKQISWHCTVRLEGTVNLKQKTFKIIFLLWIIHVTVKCVIA